MDAAPALSAADVALPAQLAATASSSGGGVVDESVGARAPSQHGQQLKKQHVNPALFRTKLCMAFSKSGRCVHGSACLFAHGQGQHRGSSTAHNGT